MNRKLMRAGRLASGIVFLAVVCAFGAAFHLAFAADQAVGNSAKGVSAPLDYFKPPHQTNVHSYLEAAQSEMGSDGTVILHDAKLQTFYVDGSKEMIMSAPNCLYDYAKGVLNSSGPLKVQTWDHDNKRALQLQGSNGFFWRQTNSMLIVSNKQTTTISGPLTNSFNP